MKPDLVEDYYLNYILRHTQKPFFFDHQEEYTDTSEDIQVTSFIDELDELHETEQGSSLPTPQEDLFERTPLNGQHEQLYGLFTIGLESLLLGHTASNAHRSTQNKMLQPLPEIVPSVFSPNYHRVRLITTTGTIKSNSFLHQEMTQRSHLIPSIAKSLSSILKLPNHQSLQSKLTKLNNQNVHQYFTTDTETDTNSIRNIISTSLFRIAQKHLYKPQASRKLRFQTPLPEQQCKNQPTQLGEVEFSLYEEEELLGFSELDENSSCAMLSTNTAPSESSCGSLPFSHDDYEDGDDNDDVISNLFDENDMDQTMFSDDMAELEGFGGVGGDDDDDDGMLCGSI
ncbi:hypothetical protein AbraIFM66951_009380 [Aspergillus brasiliensis]|uniref:Uncharacterized protein n=1 Tax=Aspergillus brasiliensis TaxID=319629 RepID=A0A9W6DNM7_9EURO|nr:hypothetical protein AbraCBS73388_007779 [Aspergillus brasiliensis]GKZ46438.1 hypothetical protein AbraIFM66951_009380 [Aspergillus brasiliensis]